MQSKEKQGKNFTFIRSDDPERRRKAQAHLRPYRNRPIHDTSAHKIVSIPSRRAGRFQDRPVPQSQQDGRTPNAESTSLKDEEVDEQALSGGRDSEGASSDVAIASTAQHLDSVEATVQISPLDPNTAVIGQAPYDPFGSYPSRRDVDKKLVHHCRYFPKGHPPRHSWSPC